MFPSRNREFPSVEEEIMLSSDPSTPQTYERSPPSSSAPKNLMSENFKEKETLSQTLKVSHDLH
ncbi:hypothetical protein NMG60_11017951 [Bertholletia excelsa]